jgi:hypothetical protein
MRRLISSLLLSPIVFQVVALGAQEDPVMKARALRAQAQGISERDLPPVPRGVVEPPPLPPPENHVRDTPGYHRSKKGRRATRRGKGKAGKGRKGGAQKGSRGRRGRH